MKTIEHKDGQMIKDKLTAYVEDLRIGVAEIEKLLRNFDNLEVEEFDNRMEQIDNLYLDQSKYLR